MKRQNPRKGAWIAITCLMAVLIGIFWGPYLWWKIFLQKIPKPKREAKKTVLHIKKFHIVGWNGSEKRWEVDAENLESIIEKGVNTFSKLTNGKIYDDEKKWRWCFRAEKGEWRSNERLLVLNGPFQIEGLDKKDGVITGTTLEWDYSREKAVITEPFHIEYEDVNIHAVSGIGDMKTGRWDLYNVDLVWKKDNRVKMSEMSWDTKENFLYTGAQVTLWYKNGKLLAGGMEYYTKDKFVTFKNGVKLEDKKDGKLNCSEFLYYPDEDRFVTKGRLKADLKI